MGNKVERRSFLAEIMGIAVAGSTLLANDKNALGASVSLDNLTQVAFVVKDIEEATQKYATLFGLDVPKIIETDPYEKAKTMYLGKPTEARAKLAFFRFDSITIELIEPIGTPSTWSDHLEKHGDSVHHLAFRVESLDPVLLLLQEKGYPTVQTGDFGSGRYAYVDTTKGINTMLELLEIY